MSRALQAPAERRRRADLAQLTAASWPVPEWARCSPIAGLPGRRRRTRALRWRSQPMFLRLMRASRALRRRSPRVPFAPSLGALDLEADADWRRAGDTALSRVTLVRHGRRCGALLIGLCRRLRSRRGGWRRFSGGRRRGHLAGRVRSARRGGLRHRLNDGCGPLFGGSLSGAPGADGGESDVAVSPCAPPALGSSSCSRSSIGRGTFAQPRLGSSPPLSRLRHSAAGFRGRPLPAGRLSRLGWSARILSRGRLTFTSRLARLGSRGFRARRLRLTHSCSRCRCIARCRRGRGRCALRLRCRRWRSRFLGGGNRVAVRDLLHPLAVGAV